MPLVELDPNHPNGHAVDLSGGVELGPDQQVLADLADPHNVALYDAGLIRVVDPTAPLPPAPATDGPIWRVDGPPEPGLGSENDVAIDFTAQLYYVKGSGGWSAGTSFKGDKGDPGDPALAPGIEVLAHKNQPNGYPGLDGALRLDPAQLPDLAITDVNIVASDAAMLALPGHEGSVAVRTDLDGQVFMHNGGSAGTDADWTQLGFTSVAPTDPRLSDTRTPTDATVTNAKVASAAAIAKSKLDTAGGLVIVDADVSVAAAIAAAKIDGTAETQNHKGAANGYMGLDGASRGAQSPKLHAPDHAPGGADTVWPAGLADQDLVVYHGGSMVRLPIGGTNGDMALIVNGDSTLRHTRIQAVQASAWGVLADGVHDDGPNINTALGAGPAVDLPVGTIAINTTINGVANGHLRGGGAGTVLKAKTGFVGAVISNNAASFRVSDLVIDGNRANATSNDGIRYTGATGGKVRGVDANNCLGNGIHIAAGSTGVQVQSFRSDNCAVGLLVDCPNGNVTSGIQVAQGRVTNATTTAAGTGAVQISGPVQDSDFTDIQVINPQAVGYYITSGGPNDLCSDCTHTNCRVKGAGARADATKDDGGFRSFGAVNQTFQGCRAYLCWEGGFFQATGAGVTPVGMKYEGCYARGNNVGNRPGGNGFEASAGRASYTSCYSGYQKGNAVGAGNGIWVGSAGAQVLSCVTEFNWSHGVSAASAVSTNVVGGSHKNNSQRGPGLCDGVSFSNTGSYSAHSNVVAVNCYDDQQLASPTGLAAVLNVGGGGSAGGFDGTTRYYRVVARNANGATPGSNEVNVVAALADSVTLTWAAAVAPPGATGIVYDVYRSNAAGGESGATSLVVAGVSGLTYTDLGALTVTGAMPTVNTAYAPTQRYGQNVQSTTDYMSSIANVSRGNATAPSSLGFGQNGRAAANVPQRAVAYQTVTLIGSPFTFTNTGGTGMLVTIQGGTGTVITQAAPGEPAQTIISQGSAGFNISPIVLLPGWSLTITYAVAPAMRWFYLEA